MGTDEKILEVKTRLFAAGLEELQSWAGIYLPLLDKEPTRLNIIVAFENFLESSVLKEENCEEKLGELLTTMTKVEPSSKAEHMVKTGTEPKVAVKLEPSAETATPIVKEPKEGLVEMKNVCEVLRVRDFKMSGTVGDGPNCMGYLSFIRQLDSGVKKGYSERDLIDGVIRAIQVGSNLRGYLEGCQHLTLEQLRAVVRAAYKERTTSEMYQDLCALKQGQRETLQEFLFRALELKQKILFSGKESDLPTYDEKLVIHQFRQSITTGIRDVNIGMESQNLIATFDTDEQLIQGMNEIERRHQEREAKQKTRKEVSHVSAEESVVLKELKALRLEVNALKSSASSTDSGRPRRRRACDNCRQNQMNNCRHCWNCGEADHISRKCPKNGNRSMVAGDH